MNYICLCSSLTWSFLSMSWVAVCAGFVLFCSLHVCFILFHIHLCHVSSHPCLSAILFSSCFICVQVVVDWLLLLSWWCLADIIMSWHLLFQFIVRSGSVFYRTEWVCSLNQFALVSVADLAGCINTEPTLILDMLSSHEHQTITRATQVRDKYRHGKRD